MEKNKLENGPKAEKPVRIWTVFIMAMGRFTRIDGQQRAGAFAYFTFFALFPLAILFVTIASAFIDQQHAVRQVVSYVRQYIPLGRETQTYVATAIASAIQMRAKAGILAFLALIWVAAGFITTLLSAADRAWNIHQSNFWKLSLKGLLLLACMIGALVLGVLMPTMNRVLMRHYFSHSEGLLIMMVLRRMLIPLVASYISLAVFYKLAPQRPTRFAHVWLGALSATVMLAVVESLFVSYVTQYSSISSVYGAFGGIIALLLWIYVSGCIVIYGACLCASQAELNG